MVKIIGFTNKVDGFRTSAGFMSSAIFLTSCETTAKKLKVSMDTLLTKRQSSKFKRGKGIVYQTTIAHD